ncbi:hypothetical protein ILUMI_24631 [Ignelater luminosus]|uniref:Uncharacterized protein n=1 Tax=Ignelater luminosus TaxID=2038154 RepID=A0A8K0C9V1_IGNLU|nr:hypothetical protein ILUMI_24631 [Ignelater luminosus]
MVEVNEAVDAVADTTDGVALQLQLSAVGSMLKLSVVAAALMNGGVVDQLTLRGCLRLRKIRGSELWIVRDRRRSACLVDMVCDIKLIFEKVPYSFNHSTCLQDPNRTLDKNVFIRVFNKLCETGTLSSANITSERATRQGLEEVENILTLVDDPLTSSRKVATQLGILQTRVSNGIRLIVDYFNAAGLRTAGGPKIVDEFTDA